jgi:hypothetical protein
VGADEFAEVVVKRYITHFLFGLVRNICSRLGSSGISVMRLTGLRRHEKEY